ncbi:MAG: nicotinate (nicotinamide) nucleotide adenylyltransferase [Clostridia bacterium]
MKHIGIFGGTFNPPHIGHINAAKRFLQALSLDILYVIPASVPPLKQTPDVSARQRLEMCRLAFDFAVVSDYEILQNEVSFTYKTIEHFKSFYPSDELFLLIGTDQLLQLNKWKNTEYLFKNVTFAIAERFLEQKDSTEKIALLKKQGAKFTLIDIQNPIVVSSTDIRNGAKSDFLSPPIKKYIKDNNLYE